MTRHVANPSSDDDTGLAGWLGVLLAPWRALPGLQRDIARLLQTTATKHDIHHLGVLMTSLEQQSRDDLSAAITGALAAYDAVVAERDQLRAALQAADADKAAAVADAVAADDSDDAAYNESQVAALRRLQGGSDPAPAPTPNPEPTPAPVDGPTDDSGDGSNDAA